MHRILLVGLLFTTGGVAAPVPKALKAKGVSFDGKWELVRQNNDNREVPKISPWVWEISGEELTLHWGNGDGSYRRSDVKSAFVRPPNAETNEMDYVYNPKGKDQPNHGRATLEGDEFVVCWTNGGKPPPAEIGPGAGVNYYRFKRVTGE